MTQVSMAALIAAVRSGQRLVSFPTDTVPALAVRPDRAALIFEAKQRSLEKPLILMAATPAALWPFVSGEAGEWQIWEAVAQQFWPGALTLVLPASDQVPPGLNPTQSQTIGLRVPGAEVAQTILEQTGPLATTSVNRSGDPPLISPTDIDHQFPEVLVLAEAEWPPFPDYRGGSSAGLPSTVAQWTGQGWQILRQGAVTLS